MTEAVDFKPAASAHTVFSVSITVKILDQSAKQATSKRSACYMADLVHPFCILSFVKLIPYGRKLGVKSLIFVTSDSCRIQLERLTQLLISAFPGSTIYQHTDLCRVLHDVLNNKVDAVFLETEVDKTSDLEFVRMLRRQKSSLPVFIISQTENLREEAAEAGVNDYFVQPVTEQQLRDAIWSVKNKENAS